MDIYPVLPWAVWRLAVPQVHGKYTTATGNIFGDVMEYGPVITGNEDTAIRQFLNSRINVSNNASASAMGSLQAQASVAAAPPPATVHDAIWQCCGD